MTDATLPKALISLFCFLKSVLLEQQKIPTLEQILQKRDNQECFFMFCDFFLSRVVGHTAWKDGCTKSKVSELASITDEAFAYLLVENYYEVWTNIDLEAYKNEEIQFDERTRKKKKRKPAWGKYTRNAFGAR